MFRIALLTCFLVSLDSAYCGWGGHAFPNEALGTGSVDFSCETVPASETSMITLRYEVENNIEKDGFVSKSSSSSMESRSFTTLEDFENICKQLKAKLENVKGANISVEIKVSQSLDQNRIRQVFNDYFGWDAEFSADCSYRPETHVRVQVNQPKVCPMEHSDPSCGIFAKRVEPETKVQEPRRYHDFGQQIPYGIFARKVAPEQRMTAPRQEQRVNVFEQQKQNARYLVRWNIGREDANTLYVGKLLKHILKKHYNLHILYEVANGALTVYTDNKKVLINAIHQMEELKENNMLDMERVLSEMRHPVKSDVDLQKVVEQFYSLLSDGYSVEVRQGAPGMNFKALSGRKHMKRGERASRPMPEAEWNNEEVSGRKHTRRPEQARWPDAGWDKEEEKSFSDLEADFKNLYKAFLNTWQF